MAFNDKIDKAIEILNDYKDAVVNHYQGIIDTYQEVSEAISTSQQKVVDELQKEVDLSRQIRDNTQTEEDLNEKENRLNYLKRDTSGVNDLDILALEKEVEADRQEYTDTLIDQSLTRLQEDNDLAQEQREQQIEIMNNQLEWWQETGQIWDEVDQLMNEAMLPDGTLDPNSALARYLAEEDGLVAKSDLEQEKWQRGTAENFYRVFEGEGVEKVREAREDKNNSWQNSQGGTVGGVETKDGVTVWWDEENARWRDKEGNYYDSLGYNPIEGEEGFTLGKAMGNSKTEQDQTNQIIGAINGLKATTSAPTTKQKNYPK